MTSSSDTGPSHRAARPDPDAAARVRAIEHLGVLEHAPLRQLQGVVDLIAQVCRVPVAQINLFTESEQRQIAAYGNEPYVCDLEDAMCWVVHDVEDTVVVPDARLDPRLAGNPFVDGRLNQARFYATHPLITSDGVLVGRLCIADLVPRSEEDIADSEVVALSVVADRVVEILELGLRNREYAQALDRVEHMRAELQVSHDRLAAFAGQISHDLKTPLSSVAASLGLIAEELDARRRPGDDLGRLPWLADKALAAATRMGVLVDDVLAYALVGGTEQHVAVDLGVVLAQVLDDLGDRRAGARFEVGSVPVVHGDHTQLRSLLQNLLSNALAYRHPDRPLLVQVRSHEDAAGWTVEVQDNGQGVRPEDVDRVFEPLVRVEHSVAGSGIGLATCRRIVTAHGGRISLGPATGHGTVVRVEGLRAGARHAGLDRASTLGAVSYPHP